ncbi:TetR/AcrR family transcriptional regulator [Fusibacter sp. JL216-2]|uniref:TetR/AcrR family transcriptional regulator n=1 Tax=Fusibacter sp. JL216-2 TaxID=3071453 RepID=UPI003D328E14
MPKIINDIESKLITTAEELFIEKGYDAVNIRLLAKTVGVASGTVYNYFSSKENLYQAVLIDSWDKTMSLLNEILCEEISLNLRMKKFFETMYIEVENRKGLGGRVVLEEKKKKNVANETEEKLDHYMSRIKDMVIEMINAHDNLKSKIDDSERLANVLIGSFWMLQRHHTGQREENIKFIGNYLDIILGEHGSASH